VKSNLLPNLYEYEVTKLSFDRVSFATLWGLFGNAYSSGRSIKRVGGWASYRHQL